MRYSVLEYLEEATKSYANKVALIDKDEQITFVELKQRALCIARSIKNISDINHKPILVYLPKNAKCIAAFMGILYSGNFYTPTSVKFPFPKVKTFLDILNPMLIVSDTENVRKLIDNGIDKNIILNLDSVDYSDTSMDSQLFLQNIISVDPVYTFFTSGSTGIPKGVVINNQSIIDYVDWAVEKFGINTTTVMGNQSPFYFDISTQDIYATLKAGATLVIIPEEYFVFPVKVVQFINERNINYLYWVPSAFVNIAKMDILSEIPLPNVHTMIFGGEVMPVKYLNYWKKYVPSLKCIANVCGPTETTVNYSCYIVDREFNDDELLPLGQVIPNHELILVDEYNSRVTDKNKLGELYVRGVALSPGYFSNPGKTEECYIQNPLHSAYPDIVYKTGDLAYYNDNNELVYAGRKDFQIKHMGYRIELGEIETLAMSNENIAGCCALYNKKAEQIVLVYVGDIDAVEITKFLSKLLPKYMLPSVCHKIDKMPINANGKIDRKKLAETYGENH